MSRIHAYEREPYVRTLATEVVTAGAGDRPWAVLADTILFPGGGGQPADRGRLDGIEIVDVRRDGDEVRHRLARPVAPGPAELEVDWARRFDHMQQHSGQHLLTAVALERFGWRTTAFHLGPEVSDIELSTPSIAVAELEAVEEAVAAEIRADRPVRCWRVTAEEYAGLEVRSRGLPAGHQGDIRLVEIVGLDRNTCGGTHVAATGELETMKLVSTESIRGGTRLHWIAGGRVRRRLAAHEARCAELRRVLDTGDDTLAAVAALKLEQLRDAQRRGKHLASRLAAAAAEALARRGAGRGSAVVDEHFDDADLGFLQQVARRLLAAAPGKVALLTAAGDKGAAFVVAAGEEAAIDLPAAGRRVAEMLDGRGGGARGIFQGKAGSLARRSEALAALRESLGS